MSSTHPPPKAGFYTLCHSGLCLVVYGYAVHGFLSPRMPLSEQGIWQRRGLFLGCFLSIFILGFRVLSSFSFRCSWYLVATGFVLWTVSFSTLFWSNLLCVTASFVVFLGCCLDAFPLPHEDCTAFFCFALLCVSLMLFGGLIRSRGGLLLYSFR